MEKKVTFNSKSSIIVEVVGKENNGETKNDKPKKASVLDMTIGMETSKVKKDRKKEKKAKERRTEEKCKRKIYVDEFDLDDLSVSNETDKHRRSTVLSYSLKRASRGIF